MRRFLRGVWLAAAAVLAGPLMAENPRIDAQAAFEQSQTAIGNATGAHLLTDHTGRPLSLEELRGRPLVVSLIFTSCGTVCPITTDWLRQQVEEARRALGGDGFAVLTFGFDASRDRPAQLTGFANTHHLLGERDWFIASAAPEVTEAFLRELGFSYRAAAGSFDHVTQTTILDGEGRVYRQIYGEAFPAPQLIEPLKELVLGRATRSLAPADLWNRLTFLCTVYNPKTGAYRYDYGIFFGISAGALSLILTGLFILRLWRERRRALQRGREKTA